MVCIIFDPEFWSLQNNYMKTKVVLIRLFSEPCYPGLSLKQMEELLPEEFVSFIFVSAFCSSTQVFKCSHPQLRLTTS